MSVIEIKAIRDRKHPGNWIGRTLGGKIVLPERGTSFSRSTRWVEVVKERSTVIFGRDVTLAEEERLADSRKRRKLEEEKVLVSHSSVSSSLKKMEEREAMGRAWKLIMKEFNESHHKIHAKAVDDITGDAVTMCSKCNMEYDDVALTLEAGYTPCISCSFCCNQPTCEEHVCKQILKENDLKVVFPAWKKVQEYLEELEKNLLNWRAYVWHSFWAPILKSLDVGSDKWCEEAKKALETAPQGMILAYVTTTHLYESRMAFGSQGSTEFTSLTPVYITEKTFSSLSKKKPRIFRLIMWNMNNPTNSDLKRPKAPQCVSKYLGDYPTCRLVRWLSFCVVGLQRRQEITD